MSEECLDQAAIAFILLHDGLVLDSQSTDFLASHGKFAFQLGDVFCAFTSVCDSSLWRFEVRLTLSSRSESTSRDLVPQLSSLFAGQLLSFL